MRMTMNPLPETRSETKIIQEFDSQGETSLTLRPKYVPLSFRHQYAELVLAGLHKESNLARQSPPGSKEAPNAVPRYLLVLPENYTNFFEKQQSIQPNFRKMCRFSSCKSNFSGQLWVCRPSAFE